MKIPKRCPNCVFYSGDDKCLRDYPSTTVTDKCRIRPYPRAQWVDAFIPRRKMLLDLSFLKVEPMQDKLTRKEKEQRIKTYLGAYLRAKQEELK